jgi:hypothetical protein
VTVGWRSAGWPFGLCDVSAEGLTLRSWHRSWWLPQRSLAREDVEVLQLRVLSGAAALRVRSKSSAERLSVRPVVRPRRLIAALAECGYRIEAQNAAAGRLLGQ